jgi:hypothetical protein
MKAFDLVQDSTGKTIKTDLFANELIAKESFIKELGYTFEPKCDLDNDEIKTYTLFSEEEGSKPFLSDYYETALLQALTILGYSVYEN